MVSPPELVFVDDPIKPRTEEESERSLAAVLEWYEAHGPSEVGRPITLRFHENDLFRDVLDRSH